MATSAKKGKNKKGKTVQLQVFLGDSESANANQLSQVKVPDWADDVEDEEYVRRPHTISLPTAPRASRILNDDAIPQSPPFNAFVSNLPYDLNESDIHELFEGLTIINVRLPREDGDTGRLRGFGYIEFGSKEDLIDAVRLPEPMIRNRRIKVDLPSDNEKRTGGGNWRQKNDNRGGDHGDGGGNRRGFSFRDRERDSNPAEDGGSWRSGDRPKDTPPSNRRNNFTGDSFKRRGFEDRNRNDNRDNEVSEERPKLNIAPRTLPIENPLPPPVEENEEPIITVPKPQPVPAAKIFGNAKPVDTAAREREIEERIEKERLEAIAAAKEAKEAAKEKEEKEVSENEKIEEKSEVKTEDTLSWRKRSDNVNVKGDSQSSSPPRKYSPVRDFKDRKGPIQRRNDRDGERRNDWDNDRRGGDRDYRQTHRDRDFNKDRNDRDSRNKDFRDREYNKDNRDRYASKPNRDNNRNRNDSANRRENITVQNKADSDDGNKDSEDRMPKYQPPAGPNLTMSNKFCILQEDNWD